MSDDKKHLTRLCLTSFITFEYNIRAGYVFATTAMDLHYIVHGDTKCKKRTSLVQMVSISTQNKIAAE